ncbi:MAG TPA: hypothetical protein VK631_24910 [Solirubrobacteraceae bacterium]|nr:hypothetical protein [Solirubrobacteraceae bacterium]
MTDRKRSPLPKGYQFGDALLLREWNELRARAGHVHDYAIYDPSWHAHRCRCGLIGATVLDADAQPDARGRVKPHVT